MRWRYEVWNRTGRATVVWINPQDNNNYLVDSRGQRYDMLRTSNPYGNDFPAPDGQKILFWVDFEAPARNAGRITANFATAYAHLGHTLPTAALILGPGSASVAPPVVPDPTPDPKPEPKSSDPVTLTLLLELGAVQESETLEGTIGDKKYKWDLTKTKPKIEETITVPPGTPLRYDLKSRTVVVLNGKKGTYVGSGTGIVTTTKNAKLTYIRDTSKGPNNFGCVLQEVP
jgi:hypothetical protein